jgi:tRNA(fMet)-specific endonuclease VapC
MLRYLLDTNVVSEPIRPRPATAVLRRLEEHGSECAMAATVWHELWFGCMQLPMSRKRKGIEQYLLNTLGPAIVILPYDSRVALWHAEERARLRAIGQTPAFADGQIAAVAATQQLTLVTFNRSDYMHFRDLQIEDWRES